MPERKLLLDTCALLWLDAEPERLSKAARSTIDAADIVCVSAISAWEVSLKELREGLTLPCPVEDWFPRMIDAHGLLLVGLDVDVLLAANRLPPHHRDPADRFIIATAIRNGLAIVTGDRRFHPYDVRILR
jgi:PIN domain nuclease of toxin-antitoxin system